MIVVNKPENCMGCLICEMACSFHHVRKFSRNFSSIKVNKSIYDKDCQIKICYHDVECKYICDLCSGEKFSLCIRLCPEDVFKLERQEG